jgi:hypothetical protein
VKHDKKAVAARVLIAGARRRRLVSLEMIRPTQAAAAGPTSFVPYNQDFGNKTLEKFEAGRARKLVAIDEKCFLDDGRGGCVLRAT